MPSTHGILCYRKIIVFSSIFAIVLFYLYIYLEILLSHGDFLTGGVPLGLSYW